MKRISAFTICALLVAGASASADTIRTRAWAHDGFGRIVFDWSGRVGYEAKIVDRTLTVSFDREIETGFEQVSRHLGGYISKVEVGADGRSVVASLTRELRVRTLTTDSGVVVDLLPAGDTAAASTTPSPEPAVSNEPVSQIGVRVGEHADYSRVVFDWTRSVDYKVDRNESAVTITFNAPGAIDVSRLSARRASRITRAAAQTEARRSTVQISVDAQARLRHFRSGTKVVLDVLDAPGNAKTRRAAKPPSTPGRETAGGQTAAEVPAAKTATPIPKATGSTPLSGDLTVSLAALDGEGVRISIAGAKGASAAAFLRAGYAWVVFDADMNALIDEVPEALSELVFLAEQVDAGDATAMRFKIQTGLGISVETTEDGWILDLSSDALLPEQNIEVIRREMSGGGVAALLPVENAGGVVRLLDPEGGDEVHVVPLARIGQGVTSPKEYVQFRVLETALGAAVVPLSDDVRVSVVAEGVRIDGGEFGLALSVPATGSVGESTESAREESVSEAEAEPESAEADVDPEATDEEETIAGAETPDDESGLFNDVDEEAEGEDADVDVAEVQMPLAKEIYLYDEWRLGEPEDFQDIKQEVQLAVANTPAAERNDQRWVLARFYFAHGFAADALGVLRLIAQHDPRIVQEAEFLTLRGACHYLMAHYDWAEEDLFAQSLDGEPEVALWRGAVYAEKQEWELARDEFAFGGSVIDRFPGEMRARFMLASARVALEIEQFDMLDQDLTLLAAEDLSPKHQAEADLVRGQALELIGDEDGALDAYESAAEFGFRPSRARAELRRVNLQFNRQELSFEDALEGLERLRFAWRGDDFEFNLLRRLGDLYIERGKFREGLTAMREAVTNFRDTPESRKLQEEMDTVFRRLFLEGEADQMEPVRALAVYYDFRELTPVGKEGDEMIRQLADRLVSVDLLDRAAQLLEHQVKFRLRRQEKARVGVKLAAIHLMDKQPEKVLEVLKYSRWKPLPRETVRERKFLEARAHSAMGKYQSALNSLVGEKSREARLIRSDIYWRSKDWVNASATMQSILGERWKDDTPLTDEERHHVMRLAVALVLAEDGAGIVKVRKQYQTLMASTPDQDAFEIVTREVDPSTIEFRKVAAAVAQIDTLESFMARYAGGGEAGG